MKVNRGVAPFLAISTSKVLLVPYEASHVTTYHEWMQDKEIQAATASEPLSLEEEYEMQSKWRNDRDKLTFIVCEPLSSQKFEIKANVEDAPRRMIGDVNLFISANGADEEGCIGELELMVALKSRRRQGYGRAATVAFLHYISLHIHDIRNEFLRTSISSEKNTLSQHDPAASNSWKQPREDFHMTVKIGEDNPSSINLFESLGFVKTDDKANFFGEFELSLGRNVTEAWTRDLMQKYGVEDYKELPYVPSNSELKSKGAADD
ncbi:N-acetyltransferase 9-like protein [Lachnellula suecica]|uniref:N-acetyltransferase 9-like protein n=1 Tax=Lachnellula suecica TaxID=602035 RepID=A0A8T9C3B9_9HELO|nr:N-acetyltransferase 9-like protein [Lachnellula suecica]